MKKMLLFAIILSVSLAVAPGPVVNAIVVQDGAREDIYYRDGVRFALEGRLEEAAKAFEQASTLNPSDGNAFYSLGNVYSEMGRWDDAINAYYKAISLNKDDVEAYNGLGVALTTRGEYEKAATAFERTIKIFPKWAEPYYHLSQVRRHLHQEEAAQVAYDKAVRLQPDYASKPPQTFAAVSAKQGTPPGGKVLESMSPLSLGTMTSESPNVVPLSVTVATQPTIAPTITTPAMNATPNASSHPVEMDARGFYDLGISEARAGRYEKAVAAYRQSIHLDSKNTVYQLALGDAYAAMGRWRESVDAYEQAARLNPDDTDIYRRLGRSYAKMRETSSAPKTGDVEANIGAKTASTSNAVSDSLRPSGNESARGSINTVTGDARGRDELSRGGAAGSTVAVEDGRDPTTFYRVGPGDVLDVRVLNGQEHRTTSFEIAPTGLLTYPSLPVALKVAGLTTDQVAARLGEELKLRAGGADPEVAVGVREYASHAIIVSGMVKEAGTKILQREGVPLYVIIAYAQPLPGAAQAVVVSRVTGRAAEIDLSDTRAMKLIVRPGDVVTVRSRPLPHRRPTALMYEHRVKPRADQ